MPNDGQALTTPDVQRMGDGAAFADDRVYEVLTTPPSLGAKTIAPTSVEVTALNPRLLCVPGAVAGTVQLQPCSMQAGSPSVALAVALQATLKAALASALFSANSSGSTRYDLLYATVQRVVTLTGPRAIKSTADGTISNNPSVNLQDEPTVTLTILPNVGNVTPLATMPADNNGGSNGEAFGSYNFPIALVALPNGYASGAISQSMIMQMWSGGWVPAQRIRGLRPASIYSGAASEKASGFLASQTAGVERWGSEIKRFAHLKYLSTTGNTPAAGAILDASINWANRIIWGFYAYLGSATNAQLESAASALTMTPQPTTVVGANPEIVNNGGLVPMAYSGPATTGRFCDVQYQDNVPNVTGFGLGVNSAGNLTFVKKGSGPIDAANGDLIVLVIYATDQFVAGA